MTDERLGNIEYNINQLESILDELFASYNDFVFDDIPSTSYSYKGKMRFIPLNLKKKVDTLFTFCNMMNESKNKLLSRKR